MVEAIILFIVGLVLICAGGDRLVDAAVAIAKKLGIPQIVVGATIVSLGTTLPEILVSTTAAFDGSAAIAASLWSSRLTSGRQRHRLHYLQHGIDCGADPDHTPVKKGGICLHCLAGRIFLRGIDSDECLWLYKWRFSEAGGCYAPFAVCRICLSEY